MSENIKALAERVLAFTGYASTHRLRREQRTLAREVLRPEPQYYCDSCGEFVDGEPSGNADSYDVLCPDRHVIVARRNAKDGE